MLRPGGPKLPYNVVTGVVPLRNGWMTASCKIAGITMSCEDPVFYSAFVDILDNKPTFDVVAVHSPIGYLDQSTPGGRNCDREARAMLGARRGSAIRSAPSRAMLRGEVTDGLDAVSKVLLRHYREIAEEVTSYRQRTVYEVEPELTFFELNDRTPLRYSKHSEFGRDERRKILEARIQGVDRILSADLPGAKISRLLDAAACMWTARRIFAKVGTRIPEDPEWDSEGVRMEIVC
jgi:predicted RNase H-like nuclease